MVLRMIMVLMLLSCEKC